MIKRKTKSAEIPTSSMADIAFLLLLFFLVATVIDVDTGIGLTLPELSDVVGPVSEDRMASILINENGDISLDDNLTSLFQMKDKLKLRISSKIDKPKKEKLIVSIKTDRKNLYNRYIQALDQTKLAYFEIREEYSNTNFGKEYKDLPPEQLEKVQNEVPIIISLAEPELVKK